MIWQNPWAWAGAVTLAIPILIHLLGRGRARVLPFPTLRFLSASRLLPTRRTRLHDPLLLALRLAILAAAVAALAQPLYLSASRASVRNRALARVVIVDTSASMRRATAAGEPALAAARREAKLLADSAQQSITIESAAPATLVPGASTWLSRQPARREIVVVSDFQLGALSDRDLAGIPHETGVRLIRIPVAPDSAPIETRARSGSDVVVARTVLAPAMTTVGWSKVSGLAGRSSIELLAGADERDAGDAAARAAHTVGVRLPLDTSHAIAIVYPRFEQRSSLRRSATTPRRAWMTDVIVRLREDSLLASAASAATVSFDTTNDIGAATGIVVARNGDGRSIVVAAEAGEPGPERLLLFSFADAGTLTSAALIAAAERATSLAPPVAELEPATIPDNVLATWQRAPAARAPRGNVNGSEGATEGASDGRWLWMLVLLLLGVETLMRRAPTQSARTAAERIVHDRVA